MKNEQTIITAIHNIKSNKGSFTAGIDKTNIDKYVATQYEEHPFLDDYINKAKSSVRKVALDNARKWKRSMFKT